MSSAEQRRTEALREVIAAYGDAPITALLDLARELQVAVHYQHRDTFPGDVTDEQWEVIAGDLDSYDEWLENSGARESIFCWQDELLTRAGYWADEVER